VLWLSRSSNPVTHHLFFPDLRAKYTTNGSKLNDGIGFSAVIANLQGITKVIQRKLFFLPVFEAEAAAMVTALQYLPVAMDQNLVTFLINSFKTTLIIINNNYYALLRIMLIIFILFLSFGVNAIGFWIFLSTTFLIRAFASWTASRWFPTCVTCSPRDLPTKIPVLTRPVWTASAS
jgi:hypothetical protein